jgi:hypothetical protein
MLLPAGDALDAFQYTFDTPYVIGNGNSDIRAFAIESFPPGRPLLQATMDLTTRIFEQFEYRGGVSDVSTPVTEVLEMRQGVCQDFAHLQIACLRCLGLPARYVSGYLLTHAPEGQQKLVGSDASHAWLSVWSEPSGHLAWVYLLAASAFGQSLIGMSGLRGSTWLAPRVIGVYPEAFLTLAQWRFASEFPRISRFGRFDRW